MKLYELIRLENAYKAALKEFPHLIISDVSFSQVHQSVLITTLSDNGKTVRVYEYVEGHSLSEML